MRKLCTSNELATVCKRLNLSESGPESWDIRFAITARKGLNYSEKNSVEWFAYSALYEKHIASLASYLGQKAEMVLNSIFNTSKV